MCIRDSPLSPEIQFVDKDAETEFEIIILGCSSTDFDDESSQLRKPSVSVPQEIVPHYMFSFQSPGASFPRSPSVRQTSAVLHG